MNHFDPNETILRPFFNGRYGVESMEGLKRRIELDDKMTQMRDMGDGGWKDIVAFEVEGGRKEEGKLGAKL